jgi:hypothetical protein
VKATHLLSCLPLGQLAQTLLACPHRGVDDLQEQLSSPRVEDEDCPVDWLCRQVTLKRFVDGHTVDVRVIHKPYDLRNTLTTIRPITTPRDITIWGVLS